MMILDNEKDDIDNDDKYNDDTKCGKEEKETQTQEKFREVIDIQKKIEKKEKSERKKYRKGSEGARQKIYAFGFFV